MNTSLSNPFFATRAQVVDLARRRYFEDGIAPAGIVSEAVFQSWARCQRLHDRPEKKVEFQPVSQSRALLALQRNRTLHEAWQAEVPSLQQLLGTTSCAAMLTDGTGVLIGAACAGRPHESLMPVATRLGVNLSEEAVGTTAPGVVIRTGQPVSVLGSEHYFEQVRQMHCAAAPIRDIQGALAGVLDISSESVEFGFDAGVVVGHLACSIENRLLLSQSAEHLVLRVQVAPPWLDTSSVGLVGIRLDGRVAWVNGVASRLLGLPAIDRSRELPLAESVLGASFGHLASLSCDPASLLALPNGLSLWVRPDLRSLRSIAITLPMPQPRPPTTAPTPACLTTAAEAVEPSPSDASTACRPETGPDHRQTVATTHQELLERTLRSHGGNVSMAARALGVSRGWVYRRMQGVRLQAGQCKPDSGGR